MKTYEWKADTNGYVIELSADEVELLYDALDARNDRFENWERGIGCDQPPTGEDKARFQGELQATSKLNDEFQLLIGRVREDRR